MGRLFFALAVTASVPAFASSFKCPGLEDAMQMRDSAYYHSTLPGHANLTGTPIDVVAVDGGVSYRVELHGKIVPPSDVMPLNMQMADFIAAQTCIAMVKTGLLPERSQLSDH